MYSYAGVDYLLTGMFCANCGLITIVYHELKNFCSEKKMICIIIDVALKSFELSSLLTSLPLQ